MVDVTLEWKEMLDVVETTKGKGMVQHMEEAIGGEKIRRSLGKYVSLFLLSINSSGTT